MDNAFHLFMTGQIEDRHDPWRNLFRDAAIAAAVFIGLSLLFIGRPSAVHAWAMKH
jgi:hypothetical protein